MYCRTKYNLSRGDVELCPTSTHFVEWRLTRNISICIMLFFVELRASKNITLSNQQNISFCNQRNRTICPCPTVTPFTKNKGCRFIHLLFFLHHVVFMSCDVKLKIECKWNGIFMTIYGVVNTKLWKGDRTGRTAHQTPFYPQKYMDW